MDNMLEVRGVTKTFAGVRALSDVSMEIKQGEIHCLAGENGSGKSTLIKVISGVHAPDSGEVVIGGRSYRKLTPNQSMGEGIQIIYQDFSLFPNLTVAENIAMNLEHANGHRLVNWRRMKAIAREAVEMVDFQVDLEERVEKLSVADKQMVAICRAIINKAKLLIMDEPTTALTRREINKLFGVITALQDKGMAILFVSHKLDEVFEISQRFTILRNGEKIVTGDSAELDHDKFVYYMTGRRLEETPTQLEVDPESEPILELDGVGMQQALKDISFSLRRGEILGIAGLLGSGRNELALTLFGQYKITEGSIRMGGREVQIGSIQDAMGLGIGLVPEDRLTEGLILRQSIGNNMTVCTIDRLTGKGGAIDRDKAAAQVNTWVENLKIKIGDPGDGVTTLSGGNQQKVVLAKWLMDQNLTLLILNGPTVGVDIGAKYDIHAILRELAERGLGVIVISDDIPELMNTCTRVLIMRAGRITDEIIPARSSGEELMALMVADG